MMELPRPSDAATLAALSASAIACDAATLGVVLKTLGNGVHGEMFGLQAQGACDPTHAGMRPQPCLVTVVTHEEFRGGWEHERFDPPMYTLVS
jgi:hypothetical protein